MPSQAVPSHALPCPALPRQAEPGLARPCQAQATPCQARPRRSVCGVKPMPCHAPHRPAGPRLALPRHVKPNQATPSHALPRRASPGLSSPRQTVPSHAPWNIYHYHGRYNEGYTMRSTTDRGYGSPHQTERAIWAREIAAAGGVLCRRGDQCLEPNLWIKPNEPWDLGHPDAACPLPKAPEHRRCNRSIGGANGATVVHAQRLMTVRDW
jgi:hypothetical protein